MTIIEAVELEKTLLRKVGEAIHRFKMIRDGDRVAVALSGGKDSATLLEALLLLQKRAPIEFSVCAFTVEQGKFLRPIEPLGEYLKQRGVRLDLFPRCRLRCGCWKNSRTTAAICAAAIAAGRSTKSRATWAPT